MLGGPGGEVRGAQSGWGAVLWGRGLLDLSPTFVRSTTSTHTPPSTAPKDVATLSLTVLKDPGSAARPVGRYLLHAKSYSVSGPCPQLLCGVFALCGILSPSLPLDDVRNGLGQSEEMPQVKLGKH